VVAALLALAVVGSASARPQRTESTLQLRANFGFTYNVTNCPSSTPATTKCYAFSGGAAIQGLGSAAESYTVAVDSADPNCIHSTFSELVITVAGKGEIDAKGTDPDSCDPPVLEPFTFDYSVDSGSGIYDGATGSGTVLDSASENTPGHGSGSDDWRGSLTVPSLTFDTTAPVLKSAGSKTIHVGRRAKYARVRYAVSATDAVDGAVPVHCSPASGNKFPVGRTTVTCSATDSSANTAQARFTITVRRRGR
jgi:hypothetical protein